MQPVHLARLGDVPVLAELAGQVAAGGAEREHAGARVEVVERLLLDRVDAEARAAAVGGQHHASPTALAHEAQAALALVQRQSRGHRSHWMRPSGSACHQRAGALDSCTGRSVRAFMPTPSPPRGRRTCARGSATACTSPTRSACRQAGLACLAARRGTRRLSGRLSQTCGRKVARWPSHSKITPSSPGRRCAPAASASLRAERFGADRAATPRPRSAATRRARASRSAGLRRPRRAHSRRRPGRAAASPRRLPTQPRSWPSALCSVTKVAPGLQQPGQMAAPPAPGRQAQRRWRCVCRAAISTSARPASSSLPRLRTRASNTRSRA